MLQLSAPQGQKLPKVTQQLLCGRKGVLTHGTLEAPR